MTTACKNTNPPEPTKPHLSFSPSLRLLKLLWETFIALTIHFELDLCLIFEMPQFISVEQQQEETRLKNNESESMCLCEIIFNRSLQTHYVRRPESSFNVKTS